MSFKSIFKQTCNKVSKVLDSPNAFHNSVFIGTGLSVAALAAQYATGTQTTAGFFGGLALPIITPFVTQTLANVTAKIGELSKEDRKIIDEKWDEHNAQLKKINKDNFEPQGAFSDLAGVAKVAVITELFDGTP